MIITNLKLLIFSTFKLLLFILLVIASGNSYAQNNQPKIDSLLSALSKSKNDTVKINILNELGWQVYKSSNYKSALSYANQAMQLSEKNDFKKGKAKAYNTLGSISLETGDFEKAIENFSTSIDLKKQMGSTHELSSSYSNLGIAYAQKGIYHQALKCFHESLRLDEEAKDKMGIAYSRANIGLVYYSKHDYELALKNYLIAHKIYESGTDKGTVAMSLINIGNVYNQMGQYSKALENLHASLDITQKIEGRDYMKVLNYGSLGTAYKNISDYPQALNYFQKAIKTAEQIGDILGAASNYQQSGEVYILQKNPVLAKEFTQKALDLSKEIQSLELSRGIYQNLSEADGMLGNYKDAYRNHKLFTAYKDSLFNQENIKEITRLEMDREFLEQENEIAIRDARLEIHRKQQYLYLSGIFGLCAIGGLLFFQNKQRKKFSKKQLDEQQKVTASLLELDITKSRFLTNITHEFRTPLTLIKGQVELMKNNSELNNSNNVRLNEIEVNSQILLDLINKLLDLSKLESGTYQLNFQKGDLLQEIKNIYAMFDSLAQQKNIELKLEIQPDAHAFLSDQSVAFSRDAITSIIANLLSNALKFTENNGKIELKVKYEFPDFINIYIVDNGLGISEKNISKIFDRFYQADDSSIRNHGGSGIGLALVKEFAVLHGGDISVKSEEGKGTEFIVYLNISNQVSDEIITENSSQNLTITNLNYKNFNYTIPENQDFPLVLIVEDNEDLQKFIKESLSDLFNIKIAQNGEEGFHFAKTFIPDLIISDVMMPKMNGIDLCQNLKSDTVTSHIPVILLTAKSGEENKLKGLQIGADDYLIKPFSVKELTIRANNLIKQRRLLRNKFSTSVVLKPEEMELTSRDQDFLNKIISIVEENINNAEFGVENLAEKMSLSTSQLNRKLKAITNQTTVKIIRNVKLQKAYEMLKANADNIAGIAYSTGFESPGYFTKVFKEHFGFLPSDREKINENQRFSPSQTTA